MRIDNRVDAPPQFTNCCIGRDENHDFWSIGRRKPELAVTTNEAVDLAALLDPEFVFDGAILPLAFGGVAEILN